MVVSPRILSGKSEDRPSDRPKESWPVLYKPKFCSLREAATLIANHLADADREHYTDPAAALHDARAQLLQALFEGAVRSEGVSYEVGPQEYGPPSIEYDRWIPIDQGVWLHEKCEESDHIYHLDSIEVYWDRDEISYFDSDGYWAECGERKIRLVVQISNANFQPPI